MREADTDARWRRAQARCRRGGRRLRGCWHSLQQLSDCPITDQRHHEVACNVDTHQCLQLTSAECPRRDRRPRPRIRSHRPSRRRAPSSVRLSSFRQTGALTTPTRISTTSSRWTRSSTTSSGIPVGQRHRRTIPLRIPIAVACDVETPNLDNAMTHLINDVHVPVIVSALAPSALLTAFERYSVPNNVLTVNALAYDPTFISVSTQGYLWHMLGSPTDVVSAYTAFVPLVESYLRGSHSPSPIGSTRPMKVVTVTSNSTATNALATAVENVLTWNGGPNLGAELSAAQLSTSRCLTRPSTAPRQPTRR